MRDHRDGMDRTPVDITDIVRATRAVPAYRKQRAPRQRADHDTAERIRKARRKQAHASRRANR